MNLTLKLNAKFQPMHRFELEDALQDILKTKGMGEITGGGTMQEKNGEIEFCDIEIQLLNEENVEWLAGLLNRIGIPKGSVLYNDCYQINVGTLDGLAIYLNGTDLPKEVYQSCDINYAIEQMNHLLGNDGRMYSYWEADTFTALYFYGASFVTMQERLTPFIKEYPLCRKCRIEQIA